MDAPRKPMNNRKAGDSSHMGMFAMMTMMMVCCLGIFLLVAIMPLIGWPAGITLAVVGGAAMMYIHQRMIKHDSHH
jgi:cobalamin synthase